ncbi:hypothetical protein RV12_GL001082 [Enterococcus quebecensis]|nr:hypothetical protein RV12_GL001082 [Enterococcus quebecensis]
MSLNGFLLKKNKQTEDKLSMQRILYEEIKHHENYGGQLSKEMNTENKSYQLQLDTTNDMLVEVEITDGKELFTIKKE